MSSHLVAQGFVKPFGISDERLIMSQTAEEVWGPPVARLQLDRYPLEGEIIVKEAGQILLPFQRLISLSQTVYVKKGKPTILGSVDKYGRLVGVLLRHFDDVR